MKKGAKNERTVALRKESMDRNGKVQEYAATVGGSLSARRAWIEIRRWLLLRRFWRSLSARRAWIEIRPLGLDGGQRRVALRKESVDRNLHLADMTAMYWVALRKESVDRNCKTRTYPQPLQRSLSARRAWIEIASFQ